MNEYLNQIEISGITYDLVASGGTGSGVTPAEVQEMINESISGLSGDTQIISGDVVDLSQDVQNISGDVIVLSGDVIALEANLSGKTDTSAFTAHTANTAIHLTSGDVQNQIDDAIEALDLDDYVTDEEMSAFTYSKDEIDDKIASGGTFDPTIYYKKSETSGKTELADEFAKYYKKEETSSKTEIDDALNEINASAFTSASYDSTGKTIDFKNKNGVKVASIDATDFIKDGMVDTVSLIELSGDTYLHIVFNTDAGKEAIDLNIGDIFEADNYYLKTETSSKTEIDDALDLKQDLLVPGDYITIDSANTISTSGLVSIADNEVSAYEGKIGNMYKLYMPSSTSASSWNDMYEGAYIAPFIPSYGSISQILLQAYISNEDGSEIYVENLWSAVKHFTYTEDPNKPYHYTLKANDGYRFGRIYARTEIWDGDAYQNRDAYVWAYGTLFNGGQSADVIEEIEPYIANLSQSKQDKLTAGQSIMIDTANTISVNSTEFLSMYGSNPVKASELYKRIHSISGGTGTDSLKMGRLDLNTASGNYSIAAGSGATASGGISFAFGTNVESKNNYEVALGNENISTSASTAARDVSLFTIGNGSGGTHHNAVQVMYDGSIYIQSATTGDYTTQPMVKLQDYLGGSYTAGSGITIENNVISTSGVVSIADNEVAPFSADNLTVYEGGYPSSGKQQSSYSQSQDKVMMYLGVRGSAYKWKVRMQVINTSNVKTSGETGLITSTPSTTQINPLPDYITVEKDGSFIWIFTANAGYRISHISVQYFYDGDPFGYFNAYIYDTPISYASGQSANVIEDVIYPELAKKGSKVDAGFGLTKHKDSVTGNDVFSVKTQSVMESTKDSPLPASVNSVYNFVAANSGITSGEVQTMIDESIAGAELDIHDDIENSISAETQPIKDDITLIKTSGITNADYDSVNKLINFYNINGTVVDSIDATEFIKDGMIEDVQIVTVGGVSYLRITFNTESGHEDIDIDLSQIFDVNNYYTKSEVYNKTEIDNRFWCGTQEQYDAISVKNPNTLYLIY